MKKYVFLLLMVTLIATQESVACAALRAPQRFLRRMDAKEYFGNGADIQLAHALNRGNIGAMQDALDCGADPNALGREGMRPLFWAMAKGSPEGFAFLLENGADPNVVTEEGDARRKPLSVMELAAIAEKPDYLRYALLHGGDPDFSAGYGKRTILYQAILHGRFQNVQLLVEAGANINHRDIGNKTPLVQAVSGNKYDIALFLLQNGADPTIRTAWGSDVRSYIETFGDRGLRPRSSQHNYYLQVVEFLKKSEQRE